MSIAKAFKDIEETKDMQERLEKIIFFFETSEIGSTKIDWLFSRIKSLKNEITQSNVDQPGGRRHD